jgi:hypothetical protein
MDNLVFRIRRFFGVGLLGLGGLATLGGLSAKAFDPEGWIGIAIFLASGWFLAYYNNTKSIRQESTNQRVPQNISLNSDTELITRLAYRLGGTLTPEKLCAQTSMSLEQAREALEQMHNQGLIEDMSISEEGQLLFKFPPLS